MKSLAFAACAWLAFDTAARAEVQFTLHDGRVTIVAKDATLRQILTEWARVGDTKIVNIERVPGGPVTLELTNVPEAQALDVVLRSLSGYIAAPRPVESATLSRFDRIILMPTLAAAISRLLATEPGARVTCVNVLKQSRIALDPLTDAEGRNLHLRRLIELKYWARLIAAADGRTTYHVLEAVDPASAIVHNYGHGGAGVTLSWGCADDVADLIIAAR